MSPRTKRGSLPQLCRHKATGRGYVTDPYTRKPVYLGVHGSPECQAAYDAWIRRFLARRSEPVPGVPAGQLVTVAHLILAYLTHAERYYVKHSQPTTEVASLRRAARPLNELYGTLAVEAFGPAELKALRQLWVAADHARNEVNNQVSRVRRMFRWGVSEGLVPVEVLQRLQTVSGLAVGRTSAREEEPVEPVPLEVVEQTIAAADPMLGAMIRLQLLASMRPEDVCRMRGEDIDRTAEPWLYRPWRHKMEHRGRPRVIPLGPRARVVLEPLLAARPEGWLFPSAGRGKSRGRGPGHLTPPGYRQRIERVCEQEGIPRWYPLQLRHTGLTEVRKKYGLEGAQMIGGHAHAKVTEVYAGRDEGFARRIAEEMG